MKEQHKKYWRSIDELKSTPEFLESVQDEFPAANKEAQNEGGVDRRDFLKLMGFGVAAVATACSRMPVKKSIPYLVQPDDIVPGKAYWYASVCAACPASCGILVKTREGRPIKIEGNRESSVGQGGLCAAGQSSVLDLYDSSRLKSPTKSGKSLSWEDWQKETLGVLKKAKGIELVTSPVVSPTTKALLQDFKSQYGAQHVIYEPASQSALIEAHEAGFGKRLVPHYQFHKAKTVVSLGADFLGTWISPVEFAKQYSQARKAEGAKTQMLQHFQFESRLSLTGSNADIRVPMKPSQQKMAVLVLADLVLRQLGQGGVAQVGMAKLGHLKKDIKKAVAALVANAGHSLVVSSLADLEVQKLILKVNRALGNYGQTLVVDRPSYQSAAVEQDFVDMIGRLKAGQSDVVVFVDVNPVYDFSGAKALNAALKKAKVVTFAARSHETASASQYVGPLAHSLETWNDAEPVHGQYHLAQPTIRSIYGAKPWQETLLHWLGKKQDYLAAIKAHWQAQVYPLQSRFLIFDAFWRQSVHDGVAKVRKSALSLGRTNVVPNTAKILKASQSRKSGLELEGFSSVALREGQDANNPWLQELPDPITKVTWENTANVSFKDAKVLGLKDGDVARVEVGGKAIELPVVVQPGQAVGSVSIALGYGHKKFGKVADGVGANVFPLLNGGNVKLVKTGRFSKLAQTQIHYLTEGRPIVRDATLKDYKKNPAAGNPKTRDLVMLWEQKTSSHNAWGMAIDLNACIGCSACSIGCQSENNVPVVGKEEVANQREMSWIRIDRYYKGDVNAPEVAFQPMMCQHCANAPCESVCPVLATVHSEDGLNQQVYNRCVGTRYCANNCPYKVRRFNWFDYAHNKEFDYYMNDNTGRLVLNPDIVVRSRGVMEKCSMCVQRIQEKKLEAKKAGKPLNSDDIQLACQQSCPSDAIVFGDLNDPKSRISQAVKKDKREYTVLGELNVKPAVHYLTKVRNKG